MYANDGIHFSCRKRHQVHTIKKKISENFRHIEITINIVKMEI